MQLPNEIIFVSGQRGGGKSYWVKKLARSLPRCVILDPLGEYKADQYFTDIHEFVNFLQRDLLKPRLYTVSFNPVDIGEDLDYFCRAILARGDIYLILEELDQLSTPYATPPELAKLIKYGRHYGIQIVGVSRRPAEVSRLFTSQATRFICFGQVEPNDIKYWRSIIGSAADQLPSMPDYCYLDIDFNQKPIDTSQRPPI